MAQEYTRRDLVEAVVREFNRDRWVHEVLLTDYDSLEIFLGMGCPLEIMEQSIAQPTRAAAMSFAGHGGHQVAELNRQAMPDNWYQDMMDYLDGRIVYDLDTIVEECVQAEGTPEEAVLLFRYYRGHERRHAHQSFEVLMDSRTGNATINADALDVNAYNSIPSEADAIRAGKWYARSFPRKEN